MKILAIDIGTGTQDILLFDTTKEVENCFQLVMPSPTVIVANKIKEATSGGESVILTGSIMGGGPSAWAAEAHLKAGFPVFATLSAARSFNDDLQEVEKMGIRILGEDEARRLRAAKIVMRDVDLASIGAAFDQFGVELSFDAIAIAVFDHGNAPPGFSDRLFRFEFLAERIRTTGKLSGFAFMRDEIPERLTRMRAVAESVSVDEPLMVMDTAPAAVLGALDDDLVRRESSRNALIANIGNFHTLAFRFSEGKIEGVFEHHTGELNPTKIESFLEQLASGEITQDEVYHSQGHGAVMFERSPRPLDFLAVTGPRRSMLLNSRVHPYFAVPYGDMMLAGDFGLIHAFADLNPGSREGIEKALASSRQST